MNTVFSSLKDFIVKSFRDAVISIRAAAFDYKNGGVTDVRKMWNVYFQSCADTADDILDMCFGIGVAGLLSPRLPEFLVKVSDAVDRNIDKYENDESVKAAVENLKRVWDKIVDKTNSSKEKKDSEISGAKEMATPKEVSDLISVLKENLSLGQISKLTEAVKNGRLSSIDLDEKETD